MKYLTNSGLSYFLNKIKAYIASQLNSKAAAIHTHTYSDITDLPNGYVVDSTLDGTSSNAIANSAVTEALDGKSNTGHTHTKSQITDFPALSTVATSGSYNDLSNKPTTMAPTSHTHGNITNNGKIGSTANKPLITTTGGTVTTGSFGTSANTFCEGNDSRLSDARTPTSHTHVKSEITDFPTIPTVNNATLKIQKNGTDVKTFTANASTDVTCNITVPTKVSELTNDSGFLTAHQSLSNYSTLANTIKSLSISGRTITYTKGDNSTGTLTTQDNNTWTAMKGATSSANGSVGYVNAVPPKDGYNTKYLRADGTWQVPPDHTYTVNNATLTIQKNGTTVKTFTANASSNVTCNITVPTKTSELTNNSGFLTSHQDLSGYVPRTGGAVMTGGALYRTVNTDSLHLSGGTNWDQGGSIILRGKSHPNEAGFVKIQCHSSVGDKSMTLKPDGTATWDGKAIDTIEEQGDGYIRYSSGIQICWGNGEYDDEQVISYPKVFSGHPSVVTTSAANAVNWGEANFTMTVYNGRNYACWQAIGRWK